MAKPWQLKTSKVCERSILGKDIVADEFGMLIEDSLVNLLLGQVDHFERCVSGNRLNTRIFADGLRLA